MPEQPFLFHPILHVSTLLEDRLRERLAPLGITPRQARILVALDRVGTASQVMLSDEFQVKAASMSTMTARLIANGYVQRQVSDEDKRTNVLALTDEGRMFLTEVFQAWRDIDDFIETAIGIDEARRYSHSALKLRSVLSDGPMPPKG